jgi:hypothetical protein
MSLTLKPVPSSLLERQLEAAEGWLDLGDISSAVEELDQLPVVLQHDERALLLRSRIIAAVQWSAMNPVLSAPLSRIAPSLLDKWIHRAYGPHQSATSYKTLDV